MYPSWQYEDLTSEERLWFEIAALLMHSAGLGPYRAYLFMLSPHGALDRLSPIAYLSKHRSDRAASRILDVIADEFEIR